MTLIDALTAKRPEDGKVADWAVDSEGGRYKFDSLEMIVVLIDKCWLLANTDKYLLTRTDFTPMWETPAPMVPIAGEVWKLTVLGIAYSAFTFRHFSSDAMKRVWADGIDREDISKVMIHGQNGWRLVYSPDPERMRRAQG